MSCLLHRDDGNTPRLVNISLKMLLSQAFNWKFKPLRGTPFRNSGNFINWTKGNYMTCLLYRDNGNMLKLVNIPLKLLLSQVFNWKFKSLRGTSFGNPWNFIYCTRATTRPACYIEIMETSPKLLLWQVFNRTSDEGHRITPTLSYIALHVVAPIGFTLLTNISMSFRPAYQWLRKHCSFATFPIYHHQAFSKRLLH